ncbi:hypothetical protein BC360_28635 [Ensifer sp. LC163]|nr:hypothetical protein BC360_28635 [Ensifer sp. LC163]
MLNLIIWVQQLCSNHTHIGKTKARDHFSKPIWLNDSDVIVHKQIVLTGATANSPIDRSRKIEILRYYLVGKILKLGPVPLVKIQNLLVGAAIIGHEHSKITVVRLVEEVR